jgi:tetratricopeptide (TPR) repeat protein
VGAGAAVARLLAAARARQARVLGLPLAALAALALLANWDFGLDDGRSEEQTQMILLLMDRGRYDEAKALLAKTERTHPEPAALYCRAAAALRDGGRSTEAREMLGRARSIGAGPDSLACGRLALDLQEPALAQAFLEEAVARAPQAAEARERLGLALALQGRLPEAGAQLEEACRLDPGRASAQLNLAVVLAQEGRFSEARARAREALRLQPDYPQAKGLLAGLEGSS